MSRDWLSAFVLPAAPDAALPLDVDNFVDDDSDPDAPERSLCQHRASGRAGPVTVVVPNTPPRANLMRIQIALAGSDYPSIWLGHRLIVGIWTPFLKVVYNFN
jgi:hypothetical protein